MNPSVGQLALLFLGQHIFTRLLAASTGRRAFMSISRPKAFASVASTSPD